MKIAVLMSTYNGEKHIRTQIESILSQKTTADVSIIVRDDGSSDGTLRILEEYGIKYYTGDNLGPAKSFFDLILNNTGYDYYAFADQDDYWMEDRLEAGVNLLKDINAPALVYSNPELVNSRLESIGRSVYRKNPKTNMETITIAGNIIGCTVLFNEKLASYIRLRQMPRQIRMHDFYLASVCTSIGGKIIFDNNSHMKYRQHDSNVEGLPSTKFQAFNNRIKDIRTVYKISIADQCAEILNEYNEDLTPAAREWLNKVSEYRKTFITRVSLALSAKTHYITFNMSITIRTAILLGNR